jgi:hypothetical protein
MQETCAKSSFGQLAQKKADKAYTDGVMKLDGKGVATLQNLVLMRCASLHDS